MDEQEKQQQTPKAADGSKRHAPEPPETADLGFTGFSEENLGKALDHFDAKAAALPMTTAEKMEILKGHKERIGKLLAKGIKRSEIIAQFERCGFELPGQWLSKLIPSSGAKGKAKALGKGIKEIAEHRKQRKGIEKKS